MVTTFKLHTLKIFCAAVVAIAGVGAGHADEVKKADKAKVQSVEAKKPAQKDGIYGEIDTARGKIVFELYYKRAPMTVCSFVGLAEGTVKATRNPGKPYFDGLNFHRVVPGFVIQGGCPLGNGRGNPGYQFPQEIDPTLRHSSAGILSMANSGPHTNGSQFFITLSPTPNLDGGYNVFGKVTKGMDAVRAIRVGDKMTSVKIIRVGDDAIAFKTDQATFNALVKKKKARR